MTPPPPVRLPVSSPSSPVNNTGAPVNNTGAPVNTTGAPVSTLNINQQSPSTSPTTPALAKQGGMNAVPAQFDSMPPCFNKSSGAVVFSHNVPYQEIDGCCYFNPNYFPPDKPPPGLQYGYPQRGKRRKALRLSSRFPTQAGKFHHHANFYVKSCAEASIGGNFRDEEP